MKGYVYIITNKSMPGIYNIGYSLEDPQIRAIDLSTTVVPNPFEVEYEILIDRPDMVEQKVHSFLKEYREGKDWFRCSFENCVSAIKACYSGKIYHEFSLKMNIEDEKKKNVQDELKKKNAEDYNLKFRAFYREKLRAFNFIYFCVNCIIFFILISSGIDRASMFIFYLFSICLYYAIRGFKIKTLKVVFDEIESGMVSCASSSGADVWKVCPRCNKKWKLSKDELAKAQCLMCGTELH